jgi:predicted alpha/beta superfamily hydrolase
MTVMLRSMFQFAIVVAAALAQAAVVPVTFIVRTPATTPPGDRITIAGNVPELGPWDPARVPLERTGAQAHQVTLALAAGTRLEYKFTRGSWETVEKGAQGEEIANRVHTVARPETIRVHVATWRDQSSAAPMRAHTLSGDVRHLGRVESAALGNARDVWVLLPPSYETSPERRYPVVYFHDGQNVFDAATAFIGIEWGADETLARLAAAGEIPEVIAVAVANSPRRMQEYTQGTDAGRPGEALADRYLTFLARELKPRIDRDYRTRREREHTAIIGSSLGGLVSLYAGIAAWETFGCVAGVSPVVHWADHDLERRYLAAPRAHMPLRLWIDMGTAEQAGDGGADSRLIRELRRFRDLLIARGYVEGRDLGYLEAAGAVHNEAAWAARLPEILRFLLQDMR